MAAGTKEENVNAEATTHFPQRLYTPEAQNSKTRQNEIELAQ